MIELVNTKENEGADFTAIHELFRDRIVSAIWNEDGSITVNNLGEPLLQIPVNATIQMNDTPTDGTIDNEVRIKE